MVRAPTESTASAEEEFLQFVLSRVGTFSFLLFGTHRPLFLLGQTVKSCCTFMFPYCYQTVDSPVPVGGDANHPPSAAASNSAPLPAVQVQQLIKKLEARRKERWWHACGCCGRAADEDDKIEYQEVTMVKNLEDVEFLDEWEEDQLNPVQQAEPDEYGPRICAIGVSDPGSDNMRTSALDSR